MDELREAARSERLNAGCFCLSLDNALLHDALSTDLGSEKIVTLVEERCPFLFSSRPVFISDAQTTRMANVVSAIEAVIGLPSYQKHVLADAPDIARHDPGGAKGVFFGYDFHLSEDAVGLIEINTNAGGAMLNAVMAPPIMPVASTSWNSLLLQLRWMNLRHVSSTCFVSGAT